MSFKYSYAKPAFKLGLAPPLCTFRTSKAYLRGLIRERLGLLQAQSSASLTILDAACHALITRDMFPPRSSYYGLDVSASRLKDAFSKKRDKDILFHADLCKPLPLRHCFDVVVSCNTLSHLPDDQKMQALKHLVLACKKSGSLYINTSISASVMPIAQHLNSAFQKVEVVYFDSYLSKYDEDSNCVNYKNVEDKLMVNEFPLANDASLHSQILFIATGCLADAANSLKNFSSHSVHILNSVPNVVSHSFDSDASLLSHCSKLTGETFLFTSKLISCSIGKRIAESLHTLGFAVYQLDMVTPLPSINSSVSILGLEKEWTSNIAYDRLCVNRLREQPNVKISFLTVRSRNDVSCEPSLIVMDC